MLQNNTPDSVSQMFNVEVDNECQSKSSRSQIADRLRQVHAMNPVYRLGLDNQLPFDEQVKPLSANQLALVANGHRSLKVISFQAQTQCEP